MIQFNHATLVALESMLLWSATTIALYLFSKLFHRRCPHWWSAPIVITPLLVILCIIVFHTNYNIYINGTHWLITLLGPATVAFAVPIYKQRKIVQRYWFTLTIGVVVGSSVAIFSAWMLASAVGLDDSLRLSLLPRSISTPFAIVVSGDIGGVPNLTAVFVVLTGIFGAAFGELLLHWIPLRSSLARGSLFGMGAHVAGSQKAHQISSELGAIAGLVMVFSGILNVLAAPLLVYCVQ